MILTAGDDDGLTFQEIPVRNGFTKVLIQALSDLTSTVEICTPNEGVGKVNGVCVGLGIGGTYTPGIQLGAGESIVVDATQPVYIKPIANFSTTLYYLYQA
jgi:hypothetical protein